MTLIIPRKQLLKMAAGKRLQVLAVDGGEYKTSKNHLYINHSIMWVVFINHLVTFIVPNSQIFS